MAQANADETVSVVASDALVTTTFRQEALSRAYVGAISAGVGYTIGRTEIDQEGVDLTIHAAGKFKPRLDIQLKATVNLGKAKEGFFSFELKRHNYDLLREATMVPRILVVLHMPQTETDWLSHSPEELVLRKCAYWASLVGAPESDNKNSVTVHIPEVNHFDGSGLKELMEKARTGSLR